MEGGARLGDADVQRHLGQLGGQQAIGVDGGLHVVGLRRHNDVVEVAFVFEEAHILGSGSGQLLGQRQVVAGRQRVIERSGVHPDADRDTRRSRRGDPLTGGRQAADVAGVDAQLGRAAGRRLDGDAGVEMDVGHHGQG